MLPVVAAWLALCSGGAAQGVATSPAQPIAHTKVALVNPTSAGSRALDAVVYYPAAEADGDAIAPREGGHPVIVLLHGYGGTGANYRGLGEHLAAAGYVVVLSATARVQPRTQADDGAALFEALTQANADPESRWHGTLDMRRAALCGHSMGGGNTLRVLADNPGYVCGFCWAPWDGRLPLGHRDYVTQYTPRVQVPVAIAHGVDDAILAWQKTAKRHYDALQLPAGDRWLWLLGDGCDHMNVALRPRHRQGEPSRGFEHAAAVATAWFDKHLKGEPAAYDALVAQAEERELPWLRTLYGHR